MANSFLKLLTMICRGLSKTLLQGACNGFSRVSTPIRSLVFALVVTASITLSMLVGARLPALADNFPSHITFANIPWGTSSANVRQLLVGQGFKYEPQGDFYSGTINGNSAKVECHFSPQDELVDIVVAITWGDPKNPQARDELDAKYGGGEGQGPFIMCNDGGTYCLWKRGNEQLSYNELITPTHDVVDTLHYWQQGPAFDRWTKAQRDATGSGPL